MPSITTQGVVLRFANYRDHDRMLGVLTPQYGRLEALSRGCRRPKSPLMPASELFVHGEFVFYQSHDRYTLVSCSLQDSFYPLRLEPYRLTCASYMASLCQTAAQPGQEASELYALLIKGLYLLAYNDQADALTLTNAFLLLFAQATGYRPRLAHCAHCRTPLSFDHGGRFDVAAGGLCCPECASRATYRVSGEQLRWMHSTLQNGLSAQSADPAQPPAEMFEMLRRYVESRLETTVKASRLLP